MELQQKFKQIFTNSNILEIITYYKCSIKEYRRYRYYYNEKDILKKNVLIDDENNIIPYSFENYKLLKHRALKIIKLKDSIYELVRITNNYQDTRKFKKEIFNFIKILLPSPIPITLLCKRKLEYTFHTLYCYFNLYILDYDESMDYFYTWNGWEINNEYQYLLKSLQENCKNKRQFKNLLLDFYNNLFETDYGFYDLFPKKIKN